VKKLIFGYGETGKAVEQFFINNKIAFEIYDDNIADLDRDITNNLLEFDEVIISPGIPPENLLLSKIKSQNIKISTDLDLFFRYYKKSIKVIGVTGTNGKTSFVNIVTEFLNKNGYLATSSGNIGSSPLNSINNNFNYLVLELSSYQLYYSTNLLLDYGVILNIASDHLDWHGNFQNYLEAKSKIIKFTKKENLLVYSELIPELINHEKTEIASSIYSSIENIDIPFSSELLIPFIDLINLLDLKLEDIEKACHEYLDDLDQIEHRFEKVEFKGNITFINDSKATNFHAVTNAINRSKNIILILHGLTKNIPSEELHLSKDVKQIIKHSEMELNLDTFNGKITNYNSINEIKNIIISEMEDGDTILFSCGGASFNDFKNYKDRGNFFKKIVEEIQNES
tara:strand:- start:149 stop:1342 length:1194 start_codon:yes stop_codon:yes gene_type:complete